MKNFALIISSAALTGLVVWIVMGGLNADRQGTKDDSGPGEKASVSEVEFRKEMAEVKKSLGDLADRVSEMEKEQEALRLAKGEQPATQKEEDARVAILPRRVVEKVDKALSELNAKAKKVEDRLTQVAADLSPIRRSLYESQAKADLLNGKRVATESAIANIRDQQEELTEFVNEARDSEDGAVDINGSSFNVKDLESMAEQLSRKFNQFTGRLRTYQEKEVAYTNAISVLESKEQNARDFLEELETQKKVIQTKRESLEAIKAHLILNASDSALIERISKMADSVEGLHFLSNEEFELRRAEINTSVEINSEDVDSLFSESNDLESTEELLNDLLNEK